MNKKPIYVTQPYLPPLKEFIPYLEQIWDNRVLTNGGPIHQQLEAALCDYLRVKYISLFNNGTIALLTGLQALRITGEVITTPYSFVATSHSLLWNGIKPIFVDIDPNTFNIDPKKIEAAITPQTTAIMAVHCYGYPCNVDAIQKIADTYNLRVIYDAAHAFGVQDCGGSILRHGDLSILSFHATKIFNTFEGGAIICQDEKTKKRIDFLKNFGFADETTVVAPGINGKMSEINAAIGMLQLKHMDTILEKRANIDKFYRDNLKDITGITIPPKKECAVDNFPYFPILVDDSYSLKRDGLYEELKNQNIYSRRYFFPLISEFPMYRSLASAVQSNLHTAYDISRKILCLPIYPELGLESVYEITNLIRKFSSIKL